MTSLEQFEKPVEETFDAEKEINIGQQNLWLAIKKL